jgi:hypothetical protein
MSRENGIKGWFFRNHKEADASKKQPRRPAKRDATGGLVANSDVLNGLYYGSDPGLQFASPLAFTPISVPVSLVSIPTPITQDEKTKEALAKLIADHSDDFPIITRTKCLLGTAWRWVRYDSKQNRVVWESIPDDSITDMVLDPVSFDILEIHTHDQFKVTKGDGQYEFIERKRVITPKYVSVKWIQKGTNRTDTVKDVSMSNRFGFMPIPFAHDCGENEWRGHSTLARILRTLKASHDIEKNRCEILAMFKPKLIPVTKDIGAWLENNGYDTILNASADVFESQLYLMKEGEALNIQYLPSDATRPHTEAIDKLDRKSIIGSGIPELFWGGLATGNHASTDTQRDMAVQYINSLREEDNTPYERLFNQSLQIMGYVEMTQYSPVTMGWSRFDMASAETKARIFQMVASGVAQMMTSASGTLEDIYTFWKKFYPELPEQEYAQFLPGLNETAAFKAKANSDMLTLLDGENSGADE